MSLQEKINYFTEIKETNNRIEKYINKLSKLNNELAITNKKKKIKKIKKNIKGCIALFNEKAENNKNKLKIDFNNIKNEREKQFCKTNWFIESKRISDFVLKFKDEQEKGASFEKEKIKFQEIIFNKSDKTKGSKNMKKQIKKSKQRQKNLNEIFQNIQILVDILADIKNIVNSNKETVDFIEIHIEKSVVLSKDGAKNLDDALTYQKRINMIKKFLYGGLGIFICGFVCFSFYL